MKLDFRSNYLSIEGLVSPELPKFTVLTGLNGAGKTHLLKAIASGSVQAVGTAQSKIKYFNFIDFRVNDAGTQNGMQIQQKAKNAMQILRGETGSPKVGWISTAHGIYNQVFTAGNPNSAKILEIIEADDFRFWNQENNSLPEIVKTSISDYEQRIELQIFDNANFRKNPDFRSIIYSIQKYGNRFTHSIIQILRRYTTLFRTGKTTFQYHWDLCSHDIRSNNFCGLFANLNKIVIRNFRLMT